MIEYVVDANNRRIAKKVNGNVVKRWLYSGELTPIAELDSAGNITARFVYATKSNTPDYIVKGDTTYKVISDHLGSVRQVVNLATGEIKKQITYDEYGAVLSQTGNMELPFGFAGGLSDGQTELVRFGARDYDAEVGRWTAKDPVLFEGGTSNLYEYCLNDPINNVDLKGRQGMDKKEILEQIKTLYDAYSEGKEQKEAMNYWGELINDPKRMNNTELYYVQLELAKIRDLINNAQPYGLPEALKRFNELIEKYKDKTKKACPTLKTKEKKWWQIW